ncbi:MAG: Lrp/AsnC family transcriptional regulator [Crenarchaeota archaeon]|nr:Lrp/AsnC family transcriptional regulator [Thermoproteota archaeon]
MVSIIQLLMDLQYNFPLTSTPFRELAHNLGAEPNELLNIVRTLKEKGIIRRIGSVLNYRSRALKAALVALKVDDRSIEEVTHAINSLGGVSHNFLRENEYNIWFVIKRRTLQEIVRTVREICEKYNIRDYVILESVHTYRLDVRFDLLRGISRAKILMQKDPPELEKVSKIPINVLRELVSIDVVERPFKKISDRYGIDESYLIEEIRKLIKLNILRDFYAVLDQYRIGFHINAMIVVRCGPENVSKVLQLEEPTHVVFRRFLDGTERRFEGLYLMVHATCREVVQDFLRKLTGLRYIAIYSTRNLLPSMPHDIEYST